MTLQWIIQDGFFHETGMNDLVSHLDRHDLFYTIVKVVPFVGEIKPDITFPDDHSVICWGSYSMRHAAKEKGWTPGVFDIGDIAHKPYTCPSWGPHMLNADAVFCEFQHIGNIADRRGWSEFFLRPQSDSKAFAGAVMTPDEFYDWRTKVVVLQEDDGTSLRATTECFVAPTKKIYSEYRLWVIDDEVVTASLYKSGGRVRYSSEVDDDILAFGRERVLEHRFADAYCLDLCRTPVGIKIVEVNTINSAGFYAADVDKIVQKFENFCTKTG